MSTKQKRCNQTQARALIEAGTPFVAAALSGQRESGYAYSGRLPLEYVEAFRADVRAGAFVVYSYSTPIGWRVESTGRVTIPDTRYSVTTSKHQGTVRTAFARVLAWQAIAEGCTRTGIAPAELRAYLVAFGSTYQQSPEDLSESEARELFAEPVEAKRPRKNARVPYQAFPGHTLARLLGFAELLRSGVPADWAVSYLQNAEQS